MKTKPNQTTKTTKTNQTQNTQQLTVKRRQELRNANITFVNQTGLKETLNVT